MRLCFTQTVTSMEELIEDFLSYNTTRLTAMITDEENIFFYGSSIFYFPTHLTLYFLSLPVTPK